MRNELMRTDMLPRTLKSVLFPPIWMLTFTVAAVGCEDGSTPQDRALRPRLSSPGVLEIRAPSVPNQVVRVRHDSGNRSRPVLQGWRRRENARA